ncbi:hypothetical protein AVEN_103013-1 [Araneus ventricosus]|uniref:Uncharacterized protein n=1 Tax=Araneus ventricosus TaxID=182803 RepID=A0A4Y2BA99_ARAVE|nr:hypothetical protein AVEN_103013-1 [Araneus ventricosus]
MWETPRGGAEPTISASEIRRLRAGIYMMDAYKEMRSAGRILLTDYSPEFENLLRDWSLKSGAAIESSVLAIGDSRIILGQMNSPGILANRTFRNM